MKTVYSLIAVLTLAALALGGILLKPEDEAKAYTYSSDNRYVRTYNDSTYSYRNTAFTWASWDAGHGTLPGTVTSGTRIVNAGYAYYGWLLATGPMDLNPALNSYKSSANYEPGFAMDSSNGWVTRSYGIWGRIKDFDNGFGIHAYSGLCSNANHCVNDPMAQSFSAQVWGRTRYPYTFGCLYGEGFDANSQFRSYNYC